MKKGCALLLAQLLGSANLLVDSFASQVADCRLLVYLASQCRQGPLRPHLYKCAVLESAASATLACFGRLLHAVPWDRRLCGHQALAQSLRRSGLAAMAMGAEAGPQMTAEAACVKLMLCLCYPGACCATLQIRCWSRACAAAGKAEISCL